MSGETTIYAPPDFLQEVLWLSNKHGLILMLSDDEIIVNFKDNDTEYKVSSMKELNTLIKATETMKQFER